MWMQVKAEILFSGPKWRKMPLVDPKEEPLGKASRSNGSKRGCCRLRGIKIAVKWNIDGEDGI